MQYFYSFCLVFSFFMTANIATAQSPEGSTESSEYDPEFQQQYNQECIQTSLAEGLDEVAAKKGQYARKYFRETFSILR